MINEDVDNVISIKNSKLKGINGHIAKAVTQQDRVGESEEFPMPTPILDEQPPDFKPDWLPYPLNAYCEAVASCAQVTMGMVGMPILTALSYCNSRNFSVSKADGSYTTPINICTVIVADPGDRKSTILEKVTNPIAEYEESENARLKPLIEASQFDMEILMARADKLLKEAVKSPKKVSDARKAKEKLYAHKQVRPVRCIAKDITMEKLASLLAESGGKLFVVSGERKIFDVMRGLYSKTADFAVVIDAYDGSTIRVDRQGRKPEHVNSPALSMLIGIQKGVFKDVIDDPKFSDQGFISRTIFIAPESLVGTRSYETPAVPQLIEDEFADLIKTLLQKTHKKPKVLMISKEAAEVMKDFYDANEKRLKEHKGELRFFDTRIENHVYRIAGNIHIAKHPGAPESKKIEKKTMETAVEIGLYILSHLKSLLDLAKTSSNENCRYVVSKILRNAKTETITGRELMKLCRRFRTMDELGPIIARLVQLDYLIQIEVCDSETSRTSIRYLINPHIYPKDSD